MTKIATLVVLSALAACSRDRVELAAIEPIRAEPAKPALPAEDRAKLISAKTKGLLEQRDKMEKISFYITRNNDITSTRLDAYLSIPDGLPAILRFMPSYHGDDWIFFNTIKIMADDQIVYEKSLRHGEVVRDNAAGRVWETADYVARDSELAALKKIVASKQATIRFSGDERREDHDITRQERDRLRQIISAYEGLSTL